MRDTARQTPDDAGSAAMELITFRVGGQDFCVDAIDVKEIRGWTPATLLPNSPPYVRGVINLRGAVLPIVDLAARLALPATEPTARHVVVVVWIGKALVGLLVDAVCDIHKVPRDGLQPTADLGPESLGGLVAALITLGDRTVALLAPDRILPAIEEPAP
jgi:purine-binding chemotaxis protein CheW